MTVAAPRPIGTRFLRSECRMEALKVDVERLSDVPREYAAQLDREWFLKHLEGVVHPEHAGEGQVEFRVTRPGGEKVQVEGHIRARFAAVCARCLEPAEVAVDEPYFMVFEPTAAAGSLPEELELNEADLSWETYSGPEIDLGVQVREQCLLAVPMRPLCREDCPGIDYGDREEPSEDEEAGDPRWKALAKLKVTR